MPPECFTACEARRRRTPSRRHNAWRERPFKWTRWRDNTAGFGGGDKVGTEHSQSHTMLGQLTAIRAMNEIRAFVGHSFVEEDKVVVEKFLRHFDSLKKILPNFSWESARGAEPRELSAKVFSLIKKKNVFIGICTRRERVTDNQFISPIPLIPNP